ncbi:il-1 beta receptor [Skunkpox virus]|uniref:Interleukin-1-binding protein n=1 Tax=Skunkpox virus TaxID=160796 RepID=A0A1C9KC11_9POXV|nr:il-1 beta receptor [Skunkpox virus]AOP31671.1 il-1 beta receptor [Skunkpox virus]
MTIIFPIFFYSLISFSLSDYITKEIECIDKGLYLSFMELENEPVILPCPQTKTLSDNKNDIIWEKLGGDNDQIISIDNGNNMLILKPTQADSGIYICNTKNETYCEMMSLNLTIISDIKSNLDLIAYPQIVNERSTSRMICPNINSFISSDDTIDIRWSGHRRLRNKRFNQSGTGIIIDDARKNDAGYYKCVLKYTYRGKTYDVTRFVKLDVKDMILPPVIRLPEVVSASIGSTLTITCRVSTRPPTDADVFWTGKDNMMYYEYVEDDDDGRIRVINKLYTTDKKRVITSRLIINPVKEEDTMFTCMAFAIHSASKTVTVSIK